MKWKKRKVNLRLLIKSTVAYRIFVVIEQYLVFWGMFLIMDSFFGVQIPSKAAVSISTTLIWNGINMVTYYVWHYELFSHFKMGED